LDLGCRREPVAGLANIKELGWYTLFARQEPNLEVSFVLLDLEWAELFTKTAYPFTFPCGTYNHDQPLHRRLNTIYCVAFLVHNSEHNVEALFSNSSGREVLNGASK
jgi:hypothetical protein